MNTKSLFICFVCGISVSPPIVWSNANVGTDSRRGSVNASLHVLIRRRFWHIFQASDSSADLQALHSPWHGPVEGKYLYLPLRTFSSTRHLWGGKKRKTAVEKGWEPMLSCTGGLNHNARGNKLFCSNWEKKDKRREIGRAESKTRTVSPKSFSQCAHRLNQAVEAEKANVSLVKQSLPVINLDSDQESSNQLSLQPLSFIVLAHFYFLILLGILNA